MRNREAERHVVIVEDDAITRKAVSDYLAEHGFRVHPAENGVTMSSILGRQAVDMVILDVVLPGESGLDLARQIRKQSDVPIIMLTGRSEEIDRIIGLEIGADDYIVKPFSPRELVARIGAVLRRRQSETPGASSSPTRTARFAGWTFDLDQRQLTSSSGEAVDLTGREADLLTMFVTQHNQVISRQQVIESLGGGSAGKRSVDVTILRLRRKIEPNPKKPVLIKTLRRSGYILAAPITWIEGKAKTAAA